MNALDAARAVANAEECFNHAVLTLAEALQDPRHVCVAVPPCPYVKNRDQARDALLEARGWRPLR